jgi:type I restriction enzyme M protein
LLSEHIKKIIETYQYRKEEERYSRRVSISEISDNGYNLNISCYISTAIVTQIIDLMAVHKELVDLEHKTPKAAEKHNQFLKELGLVTIWVR